MEPDVRSTERNEIESRRRDESEDREYDVDVSADGEELLRAPPAAGCGESPHSEQQVHHVVQQVYRENAECLRGERGIGWLHCHATRREEADDCDQDEDDAENPRQLLNRGIHAVRLLWLGCAS